MECYCGCGEWYTSEWNATAGVVGGTQVDGMLLREFVGGTPVDGMLLRVWWVAVLVEALVFIVIGRSCSEGCWFDSHSRPGSFLRFNSRPIMSSPYSGNKGVRLLSILKL